MKALRPLILLIVAFAALAYVGGIIWAGIASISSPTPPNIPELVTQTITGIGAVLATNFGALFGIAQFTGGNKGSNPNPKNVKNWLRLPVIPQKTEISILDHLPVIAAYLYFFSLLIALLFWVIEGFSDQSAQVLKNMTSTLIGAAAGVLAVSLNVKR
jgi:hypothetical protein